MRVNMKCILYHGTKQVLDPRIYLFINLFYDVDDNGNISS